MKDSPCETNECRGEKIPGAVFGGCGEQERSPDKRCSCWLRVYITGGDPVTIRMPLDHGNQSMTRDISLPKLYNVKAMVWQGDLRAQRSCRRWPANLPLAAFDLCK